MPGAAELATLMISAQGARHLCKSFSSKFYAARVSSKAYTTAVSPNCSCMPTSVTKSQLLMHANQCYEVLTYPAAPIRGINAIGNEA